MEATIWVIMAQGSMDQYHSRGTFFALMGAGHVPRLEP